jgi:hypothetical protein
MVTKNNAEYLGDGVYVQEREDDVSTIVLSTNSHEYADMDNCIYLESSVVQALYKWLQNKNHI